MSKFQKDIDYLSAVNGKDVEALEDARATLDFIQEQLLIQNQYIKESLELIHEALNQNPHETLEKLATDLGAST
jgi:uncharacterized protein (DUF2164 family)